MITCCIPFHCWVAPSLVEVEVVFAPSSERWSLVVGYGPYPSSVEVDWLYCLGGIVRLREEFGTPSGLESFSVKAGT